ncbi:monocarboxylate transporter 14-like isoform X1 [Diorhabda sublineata]|uniref:monocarboxylate transporter 14-like isoform X1 n=1 Tax=Diorhabda sublineata TaxID=1163346 RepID=UPI0024E0B110|nr:monocarboxylate transporter 14-like isoform X1 [Diorhabda sublineata]
MMNSDEEYEAKAKIARKEEQRLKEEFQLEEGNDTEPHIPAPPDGGYGWVIVFASFICNMVVDGVSFSFGLLLPFLVEHYGETKGTTAWVGSLLTGFQLGAGPLVSAVANKFGCRIACLIGCVLASSAVALSTMCPSVSVMMLVYGVLGGMGYGFIYLPAVVMVGYYFESKRSLATGIAVCGTGVGAFAFAPLVTASLKNFGWKYTNLFLAGITISCALFGALMKPLNYGVVQENVVQEKVPARPRSRTSEGNVSNPGAVFSSTLSITKRKGSVQPLARKDVLYTGSIQNLKEFQSRTSLAEYRHSVHSLNKPKTTKGKSFCNVSELLGDLLDLSLLKDAVFLVLAFATLFAILAFYIPFVYLVELAKTKGIDESQGSMLISIIGITNIIGRIGVGFIADFPKVNNFLINNICLVLAAIGVIIMPLCSSFATLAAVSVVFGFSVAGYISLTSIILVEFLGLDKLTNAFGLIILFRGAAATFGTPIAGTLYDYTGSYTIPFFFGGAAFAISALISMSAPCFRKNTEIVDRDASAPINVKEEKSDNVV